MRNKHIKFDIYVSIYMIFKNPVKFSDCYLHNLYNCRIITEQRTGTKYWRKRLLQYFQIVPHDNAGENKGNL